MRTCSHRQEEGERNEEAGGERLMNPSRPQVRVYTYCLALHCVAWHCLALLCVAIAPHYFTLLGIACLALLCIAWHCSSLLGTAWHCFGTQARGTWGTRGRKRK